MQGLPMNGSIHNSHKSTDSTGSQGLKVPDSVKVKQEDRSLSKQIPELEELFLPAWMAKELRIEVGRTLKLLQKEYGKNRKEAQLHSEYVRMDGWDEKEKEKRRKLQNRAAAQRNKVKKMEMVWALVRGIQELYGVSWAFQQQAQNLQKHSEVLGQMNAENKALRQQSVALSTENARLRQILDQAGIKANFSNPLIQRTSANPSPMNSLGGPAGTSLGSLQQAGNNVSPMGSLGAQSVQSIPMPGQSPMTSLTGLLPPPVDMKPPAGVNPLQEDNKDYLKQQIEAEKRQKAQQQKNVPQPQVSQVRQNQFTATPQVGTNQYGGLMQQQFGQFQQQNLQPNFGLPNIGNFNYGAQMQPNMGNNLQMQQNNFQMQHQQQLHGVTPPNFQMTNQQSQFQMPALQKAQDQKPPNAFQQNSSQFIQQANDKDVQELKSSLDQMLKMSIDSTAMFHPMQSNRLPLVPSSSGSYTGDGLTTTNRRSST